MRYFFTLSSTKQPVPQIQETSLCQRHADQINDQDERQDDGIGETHFLVLEVHEEGDDIVGLHYGQQDENDDQDIMRDGSEGDAYFEDGDEQQDPESLPDDGAVLRVIMLLDELIMNITGIVAVRFIVMICHYRTF